jgi:hypothetical protein
MSIKSKKKKSVLPALKSLVDNLSDRDIQIKRDFRLFEAFLENFPMPVSMWSANLEGKILNKKNKGFFCNAGTHLSDVFKCNNLKQSVFESHEKAIAIGPQSVLVEKNEKTFFVTIAPRQDDKDVVIGVSGIAWDVSSNNFILNTLIDIKKVTETKSGTLDEINKKVSKAIEKSRLFLLTEGER